MANRTLFELFHKESILSTDIIPIQINTIDGVLNKVTISQLKNFINKDDTHILDITLTDSEQKLEISDMYLDHIAGKNFTLYISNNIIIDSVVSKSYILAELIFSDVDDLIYKVYIKYNTITDDDDTITKKENSITATISKDTGLVSGDIVYATKDYATYKNTYIDTTIGVLETTIAGKVDDSQVLTNVPIGAIFTDTITTINEKTGAISKSDIVALGIPAQDTVYTHPSTHSADIIVDGETNKAYTEEEKTKLGSISGSNTGDETATTIGTLINGAGEKETPIDADMVGLMDSEASNVIKKLSWSNIKATLKTYFDTLYALTSHSHAIDDIEELSSTLEGFMAGSKFTITIGDNVHSVYTINHNLATEDVLVSVIKLETKENTLTAFTIVDTNNITIDFGAIIGVDTYKVIVL